MKNILYLHTHDMGRFNGIYGYTGQTPSMLDFSREATVFQNCFCAGPTCSPSRAALLTGRSPHASGMLGLAHRGFQLADESEHLSHFLRNRGYHTALFGIQHEAVDVSTLGYDRVFTTPLKDVQKEDRAVADAAAAYFGQAEVPFFAAVGFFYPHRPYLPHTDIHPDEVRVPACLHDVPEARADFADYLTSLREADRCIGTVLEGLKRSGRYDDTMVILTTDHGIAFPFMKCNVYDTGIGVTLAIKDAGQKTGRRTDALVSHIDLFPTLCDQLGLTPPSALEGVSLRPILEGDDTPVREYVYAETNFHVAYEPTRAVRSSRYKLIRRFDQEITRTVPNNIDGGPTKSYYLSQGILARERPEWEFYDMIYDPNERNNLADDPAYAGPLSMHKAALESEMKRTQDPFFFAPDAHIPPPPGARVVTREDLLAT